MTSYSDYTKLQWGDLAAEEDAPIQETISTFGNRAQLRFTPLDLDKLPDPLTDKYIHKLPPIDSDIQHLFRRAAGIMQNQVRKYLEPKTLRLINLQLNKVNYIVVSPSSGQSENRVLGYTQQKPHHPLVIALALTDPEEKIGVFRFSSTLFHENTHVADPLNNKLSTRMYQWLLSRRYRHKILDPETAVGLRDPKETVPRIFDGVVYGTKYHTPTEWRTLHPRLLESALKDQLTLYQLTRHKGSQAPA